jgi:hypothetical protein
MVFGGHRKQPGGTRKRAECTAKTQYQKFETDILRIRSLCPNFHIHVPVSDLYLSTIGLPIMQCCRKMCGQILTQTLFWEYINGIFVAVCRKIKNKQYCILVESNYLLL